MCRACPRLVAWREEVARVKRRAHATEPYWGRPIAGWGSDQARILILGLAPAAHGGNRTGRIFTGDRSGDVLFASLHRCGLAAEPYSTAAGDGQRLLHTRMVAAVRCAPPANKPTVTERDTCQPWLAEELRLPGRRPARHRVPGRLRLAGAVAGAERRPVIPVPRPRPAFGHGAEATLAGPGRPDLPFDRLLSPESAEHVHWPGHSWHAGCGLPSKPGPRPGLRADPAGGAVIWLLSVSNQRRT